MRGFKSLLKTVSTVSASTVLGDIISQRINIDQLQIQTEIDWVRTRRMFAISFFLMAPISHYMNFGIEARWPGRSALSILKKSSFNMGFAPIAICIAFSANTLLQGKSVEDAREKIEKDAIDAFVMGVWFWPIFGTLNLYYTPVQYRPVVSSLLGVVWNSFMSNQINKNPGEKLFGSKIQ
jgi:protein Mpv17